MQDFRHKSTLATCGKPSAGQFDAYVDKLVEQYPEKVNTDPNSLNYGMKMSVKDARRELVNKYKQEVKNAREEQKNNIKMLKSIQQEERRQQRGKGCIDMQDIKRAHHYDNFGRALHGMIDEEDIVHRW